VIQSEGLVCQTYIVRLVLSAFGDEEDPKTSKQLALILMSTRPGFVGNSVFRSVLWVFVSEFSSL
jgi:hypothetical protein